MTRQEMIDEAVSRVIKGRHSLPSDRALAARWASRKPVLTSELDRLLMKVYHSYLFVRMAREGRLDEKSDQALS